MKTITPYTKLKNVPLALVDDADFKWLNEFRWNVTRKTGTLNFYYHTRINGHRFKMHRMILNCSTNKPTDHINGITWDNRRSNLRIASYQKNAFNRRKTKGISCYKGVYFDPVAKRKR